MLQILQQILLYLTLFFWLVCLCRGYKICCWKWIWKYERIYGNWNDEYGKWSIVFLISSVLLGNSNTGTLWLEFPSSFKTFWKAPITSLLICSHKSSFLYSSATPKILLLNFVLIVEIKVMVEISVQIVVQNYKILKNSSVERDNKSNNFCTSKSSRKYLYRNWIKSCIKAFK